MRDRIGWKSNDGAARLIVGLFGGPLLVSFLHTKYMDSQLLQANHCEDGTMEEEVHYWEVGQKALGSNRIWLPVPSLLTSQSARARGVRLSAGGRELRRF